MRAWQEHALICIYQQGDKSMLENTFAQLQIAIDYG
jgi:hypothetical protein